jgi:hypothetical protein
MKHATSHCPTGESVHGPTGESVSIDRHDTLSSAQNPHARKNQFREPNQYDLGHPVRPRKISLLFFRIVWHISRHPTLRRGAARDRHERWGGMRWTRRCRVRMRSQGGATRERSREARKTSGIVADGEVVWSWHPLLMLSLRGGIISPTGICDAIESAWRRWQEEFVAGESTYKA